MLLSRHVLASARPAKRSFAVGGMAVVMGLALALSACGTTSTSTSTASITCPSAATVTGWHLVNTGKLTIASDTTYAPAEFQDPADPSSFKGYDMDLAREFAKRLCLTPNIVKADFDSIIPSLTGPALGQQRYDLSISSFTINDTRKQKVDMVPYFQAGESILVPNGNPAKITKIDDMCGKTISVQEGTVEKDEIDDANGNGPGTSGQAPVCKSKVIKELHFSSEDDVIKQVLNGSADASYQDQPVTDYYISQHSGKLQSGGITVQPSPEGIVMRKDNTALETAITDALAAMRKDGTYSKILKDWGVQGGAYPAS